MTAGKIPLQHTVQGGEEGTASSWCSVQTPSHRQRTCLLEKQVGDWQVDRNVLDHPVSLWPAKTDRLTACNTVLLSVTAEKAYLLQLSLEEGAYCNVVSQLSREITHSVLAILYTGTHNLLPSYQAAAEGLLQTAQLPFAILRRTHVPVHCRNWQKQD